MGQPSGQPESPRSWEQPPASSQPPGWSPVQPPAYPPPRPGSQQPQYQQPGYQQPGYQPSQHQQPPSWQAPGQPQTYPPPQPGAAGWGAGPWAPPAPKPGIVPLRPLGAGELLDGAITVLRSRARQTLLPAAVVAVVVNVVRALVGYALVGGATSLQDLSSPSPDVALSATGDLLSRRLLADAVQMVVALVGTTVLTGLLTVVVSRAVLGRTVSTGEAWARIRPRLGAQFGVTLLGALLWLAGFLAAAVLAGLVALASPVAGAVVGGLLSLVWVPFAVWVYVLVALAPAALVLEGQKVVPALRRSRALVAGAFWRTLGLLLLVVVISAVVDGIIGVPFSVFGSGGGIFGGDPAAAYSPLALTLTAVGGILGQTITLPFTAAAVVLVYVDRRMRREGLDLELARAAAEPAAAAPAPAAPAVPPPDWTRGV